MFSHFSKETYKLTTKQTFDEAVRVAVGMPLGVNLYEPHKCPCGTLVDARGTHGLSCKQVAGGMTRHHWINDLVW
jgi:hypothetical protein